VISAGVHAGQPAALRERFYAELAARGIRFRRHVWLAEE
jgi:hypothetical protein